MKHLILSILTTLLVSVNIFAENDTRKDYSYISDIQYTQKTDPYSKQRLKLDIYYPSSGRDLPVVIWFHSGGLTGGEKHLPDGLKDAGMIVVSPNYRLIPNVSVNECIDDAAEATAWVFDNIEKYGGDPKKIFVAGHSAGGFLSSMIGLDKSRLEKYGIDADKIAGIIPLSGQVITHFSDRKSMGIGELTPWVDRNAPLFHIRDDSPPYIIITGDAEQELYGRYEENLYMWRMLKLTGHPYVKLYKLDGYNHGDMAIPAIHLLRNEINKILKPTK
ncbi:MAG: alpha/beta hydrolase [Clostridium sp.]|nr:alpha/beta hydrolase [Prevotella sp.]MCM1429536.1 alpha/beta hydrolase [Clostridium sp.]MCM1476152.1 alpha/beta hydrolase [Muribaculaceae bacterium]